MIIISFVDDDRSEYYGAVPNNYCVAFVNVWTTRDLRWFNSNNNNKNTTLLSSSLTNVGHTRDSLRVVAVRDEVW